MNRLLLIITGIFLLCSFRVVAQDDLDLHLDLRKYKEKFPLRYTSFVPVALVDEFEFLDTLYEGGVWDWEGKPLDEISDPDFKTHGWEFDAVIRYPFGNDATLYIARNVYTRSWIRGVFGQVWDNKTGQLYWQGDLAMVRGGDGGGTERRMVLHDVDLDGYGDMVFFETLWGGYQSQLWEETGDEHAGEDFWVMRWNGNGFDSIPLRNTPLMRDLYLDYKYEDHLRRIIPADSLPALTNGKLQRPTDKQPTLLMIRKGKLGADDYVWKGTGIRRTDLEVIPPRVKRCGKLRSAVHFRSPGEAETFQAVLPNKYRKKSVLLDKQKDCKTAGPFPEDFPWTKQYDYDCGCGD